MAHVQTIAIQKLRRLQKRKRVIQGGTWAGKTEAIIGLNINRMVHSPNMDMTVVAETVPALKGGALKIFKNIMNDSGRWIDANYNATDRLYKFASGSQINFASFDSIGKAKAAGKRTHLFINEAQYIPFNIAYELMVRSNYTWIDYNPNHPFWVHEELIGEADTDFLILTYKDNETTPDFKIVEFERNRERAKTSAYWENWCRVYIDGEIGSLEGVVFSDWTVTNEVPATGLIGYGMDFGYTNDPTTMIACYVVDGVRIFDEVIYQRGLATSELARLMKAKADPYVYTIADSASPQSIDELRSYGIKITGAKKGPDSIAKGISILQEQPFKVTARSTNMIKELREYNWDTDREGKRINKPVGVNDHGIDSMRYLAMDKLVVTGRVGLNITRSNYSR